MAEVKDDSRISCDEVAMPGKCRCGGLGALSRAVVGCCLILSLFSSLVSESLSPHNKFRY